MINTALLAHVLNEDFKELLQPEFTADWEEKRFLISLYLETMSLDNTVKYIKKLIEHLENENKRLSELVDKYQAEEMLRREAETMDYLIKDEERFNDYSFMEDLNE